MGVRTLLRPFLSRVLPPLAKWYLRKPRKSRYQDVQVTVPPGVFHPGLFFSTGLLLRQLEGMDLSGKSLLEIGAGSGMIAIWAAKRAATVTASELSKVALKAIDENARRNSVEISIVHSDLFENLAVQAFDIIVVNPPYYRGAPKTEDELAWYCGEELEYFKRLFAGLGSYCHARSQILMVLSEDCEIEAIKGIAKEGGWEFNLIRIQRNWGESSHIFGLELSSQTKG